MNEIKVAENKTLKLTNVLSRLVRPEELGNLPVILTQMQNFMKSNGAQPIGPLVQAVKMGTGPDHVPELYMMQQAPGCSISFFPLGKPKNASLWCARRQTLPGTFLFRLTLKI